MVRDCEQKLVVQEGFVKESDFAECPSDMFNHAYLTSIGVTGMGLQRLLLKLQSELHATSSSTAGGAKGKNVAAAVGAGGIAMGNTKQGAAAKKMRIK